MTILQFLGVIIILDALCFAGWWAASGGKNMMAVTSVTVVACLVGLALTLGRGYELKTKMGTLTATAEQDVHDIGVMKAAIAGHQQEIERQASNAKVTAENLNQLSKSANTNFSKIESALKDQAERATRIKDQIEEQKTNADAAFRALDVQIADASARVKTLSQIAEYSDVAMLTLRGAPFESGDIIFNSNLTRLMDGTFTKEGNSLRPLCAPEAQEKLNLAIVKFPKFPFSYYCLAICLAQQGKSEWVEMAQRAVTILETTTKVAGHQPAHDEALVNLRALLKKNGL